LVAEVEAILPLASANPLGGLSRLLVLDELCRSFADLESRLARLSTGFASTQANVFNCIALVFEIVVVTSGVMAHLVGISATLAATLGFGHRDEEESEQEEPS
jgi:hypothetical protein